MVDEIKGLWEFLMTGAIAVIGFFGMRTINSIDEVSEKTQNVADDLHEHKTHVAENYSTNETIKRVHDRIDALGNKIDEKAGEITTLILNMKK
jgi:gas vesicle protein